MKFGPGGGRWSRALAGGGANSAKSAPAAKTARESPAKPMRRGDTYVVPMSSAGILPDPQTCVVFAILRQDVAALTALLCK